METYIPRLQGQVRWDSSGDELQGMPAAHSCSASNPPRSASPFVGRRLWPCNGIFVGFSTIWQLRLTINTWDYGSVTLLVIAELERDARLVEVEGRPATGPLVNAIRVEP